MKIYIWSDGDSSVGLNGNHATLDIEGLEDFLDEFYRKELREKFKSTFTDIFDDDVNVLFEDETEVQIKEKLCGPKQL